MARPLRIEFAGGLYHVTSRGNAREDTYAGADDDDRSPPIVLLKSTLFIPVTFFMFVSL